VKAHHVEGNMYLPQNQVLPEKYHRLHHKHRYSEPSLLPPGILEVTPIWGRVGCGPFDPASRQLPPKFSTGKRRCPSPQDRDKVAPKQGCYR
jgi:hypothetical protein